MGSSESVYMANDSGQDIYVMAALNPDWAIATSSLTLPYLPEEIHSLLDLYQYIKAATDVVKNSGDVGSDAYSAAMALIDGFRQNSVPITYQDYKDVQKEDFLSMYLSASGIASLLGAKTVSLVVMSGDGMQVAMWDTNADDSWIATNQTEIIRSKYGSIWQPDPADGTIAWPIGG
ncbi:hypothetical protein BDZ97DRAFT_1796565 [Flammula alnicola]|nr:hypothetical protein BDZ97DRAFT_1796565 [Flammula alnicola]